MGGRVEISLPTGLLYLRDVRHQSPERVGCVTARDVQLERLDLPPC